MKRLLIAVTAVIAVAAVAWGLLSGQFGRFVAAGKQGVESWCAAQLLAIAGDHLNPTLHFERLVYEYPNAVHLSRITLAEDNVVVVSADEITIRFAGIPRRGEPLVLREVELRRPTVRLIEQPDGALLALSDFVKDDGGEVKPDGGSTRLSDVLDITKISLRDGSLSYEPPDQPAMVLRPLTLELDKRTGAEVEPGWYAFEASTTLDPVADITTRSSLNLDNGDLDVETLTLAMSLDESQYQVFTPAIQQFLQENQISGALHASMEGRVGLGDLSRTSLDFRVNLSQARAVINDYEIPIQTFDLDGSYKQNVLDLPRMTGTAFSGDLEATARFDYATTGSPYEVTVEAVDLRLEDAMAYEGMPSTEYTGDVSITARIAGQMDDPLGTLSGGGEGTVENGRIVLVELFRGELRKGGDPDHSDRAEITYEFHPDRVQYIKALLLGDVIGIRGRGDWYYDGRINFVVSAGPIERVTGRMGPLGQLFGKAAGSLVRYQVTGTLGDAKVKVLPFGIGERKEPAPWP